MRVCVCVWVDARVWSCVTVWVHMGHMIWLCAVISGCEHERGGRCVSWGLGWQTGPNMLKHKKCMLDRGTLAERLLGAFAIGDIEGRLQRSNRDRTFPSTRVRA